MSASEAFREQLAEWKSLQKLTHDRIKNAFVKATKDDDEANSTLPAFVLVLDETTEPIVKAVLGRFELVEMGCASVVSLNIPGSRAPQPALDAIYFIKPTVKNLELVANDFRILSEKVNQCPFPCSSPEFNVMVEVTAFVYNEVHLFTTDSLTKEKLSLLKKSRGLKQQLKTVKQLSLQFAPFGENSFTFNMANDLQTLFNCASATIKPKVPAMIEDVAKRLVSLCVTLDEKPLIRYKASSQLCTQLAEEFNGQMQKFIAKYGWDAEMNPHGYHPERGWKKVELAGTVIILDRVEDLIAPILHDLSYQCLMHDLLKIKNGKEYQYTNEKGKTVRRLLDNTDELYQQIKNFHISSAVPFILAKAPKKKKDNVGSGATDEAKLAFLKDRIRTFEDTSRQLREVQDHMHIASTIFAKLKACNLKAVARQEQVFATHLDMDGAQYTFHKFRQSIRELLSSEKLSPIDKARLLGLFQLASKKADLHKYMRELATLAAFHSESNLFKVPLNQTKLMESKKTPISSIHIQGRVDSNLKKKAQRLLKTGDTSWRYEPEVKSIVERHISGQLDNDDYPYMGMPAMEGFQDRENLYGPRVIVFIAGGASFNEIRVVEELLNTQVRKVKEQLEADAKFLDGADQARVTKIEPIREVILGSTSFVTPETYIAKLCTADEDKEVTTDMIEKLVHYEKTATEESELGGAGKNS